MYLTRLLLLLILTFEVATASHLSRGKSIYAVLCDQKPLQAVAPESLTIAQIMHHCHDIDQEDANDVKTYLIAKQTQPKRTLSAITPIPKEALCPVCGMVVHHYPKWSSRITTEQRHYYFDGVKDMMKYYLDVATYHYDRAKVRHIAVHEFYHLRTIDATKAWYVVGSDVRGPMGHELVPFATQKEAVHFMQDHHGKEIVRFEEISLAKMKQWGMIR